MRFCRKAWIDAQWTEEVQGQYGLVQQRVPKMKWEIGVTAAETRNQVVFLGLHQPYRCVGAVEVGCDQLKIDAFLMHKLLQVGRTFVVEHLKLVLETSAAELVVQGLVGSDQFLGAAGF